MKKILLIMSIIAFSFIFLSCDYVNPIVVFDDANFEAAVRDALEKPDGDIFARDVRTITEFEAIGKNIQSIKGIEYFSNLKKLDLESNFIQDVSYLKDLKTLEWLSLRNNEITDLVQIQFEEITDLNLKHLSLRHNVVRDELNQQTRLSDISLIASFVNLETLDLRDNHIVDMSPISGLAKLYYLDISQNPIVDTSLSFLADLSELTYLNIRETGTRNISVLSQLTELTYLNIHSNTEISSIEAISELTKLNTLIAQNVPVGSGIVHLSNLNELHTLNLQNTQINDLTVLSNLMSLGALQDNEVLGIESEVNIGANPLKREDYLLIESYWDNITIRVPVILPIDDIIYPVINEIMASNGNSIRDFENDHSDWIELYNPSDMAIDIGGYYLSDDLENITKWAFPLETIIPAKGYLVVYASGKNLVGSNGEIHTNFSISRDGEPLALTTSNGRTTVDLVLSVVIPRDYSYGRKQDGIDQWVYFPLPEVSPGYTNNHSTPFHEDDSIIPTDYDMNTESFSRLFNDSYDKSIIIKISEEAWNNLDQVMLRHAEIFNGDLRSDFYAKADFYYQDQFGEVFVGNVGFRTRGNMSRVRIQDDDGHLNMSNFKISFHETFDDDRYQIHRNRTVFQVEELDMKWNRNYDPTYLTEKYSLNLFNEFGVYAAQTTLARVYIEIGDERHFYGLYTVFEPIDKLFLERRMDDESAQGDLYKSLWQQFGPASLRNDFPYYAIGIKDASMNYRPTYDLKTNKSDFNRSKLENFIKDINQLNGDAFDEFITANFDVDRFLRYMALGVLLGNPDDYRAMGNNYYLYHNPVTNQWTIIPYDYDHGMGQGWNGAPVFSNWTIDNDIYQWGNLNAYNQGRDYANPLSHKILKIPRYQEQFEAYIIELIDPENNLFTYEVFETLYDQQKQLYESDLDDAIMNLPFGLRNVEWYFQEKINAIQSQINHYQANPNERPKW